MMQRENYFDPQRAKNSLDLKREYDSQFNNIYVIILRQTRKIEFYQLPDRSLPGEQRDFVGSGKKKCG